MAWWRRLAILAAAAVVTVLVLFLVFRGGPKSTEIALAGKLSLDSLDEHGRRQPLTWASPRSRDARPGRRATEFPLADVGWQAFQLRLAL